MCYLYPLRIYYQDTDAGGIVYHANYLNFAERARSEALREMGIPHADMVKQHGVMFVVRRVNLDYQRPARLDDQIIIETRVTDVGGASATLRQHFRRDSDSLAVLDVWLGCVRASDGRAARMPETWRDRMRADIQKGVLLSGSDG
jgi:acyl-CoA thioester hydrolase